MIPDMYVALENRLKLVSLRPSGSVAQLVEQWTENPCVGGSTPSRTTLHKHSTLMAFVAVGVSCFLWVIAFGRAQGQDLRVFGGADVWGVVARPSTDGNATHVTTQPAIGNQLVVNHVVVGVEWAKDAVRARIALQEGAFTRANYGGADSSWRMLHEASMHIRIGDSWTLDAGVLPSTIGFESMLSWTNPTMSRSLIADHTPYYMLGVHGRWQVDSALRIGLVLMNGWQQIVDANRQPAVGTTLLWRLARETDLAVNTFAGLEPLTDGTSSMRYHVNTTFTHRLGEATVIHGLFDVTNQQRQAGRSSLSFYAGLQAVQTLGNDVQACLRLEHADDSDRILYKFGTAQNVTVSSASMNIDVTLRENLRWRSEVRGFYDPQPTFVIGDGASSRRWYALVMTGLSIWL